MSGLATSRKPSLRGSGGASSEGSSEAAHEAAHEAEDAPRVVPRLALRFTDAAEALDMSVDSFERYVASEIRILVCGRMKRAPIAELERYIEENAYQVGADW